MGVEIKGSGFIRLRVLSNGFGFRLSCVGMTVEALHFGAQSQRIPGFRFRRVVNFIMYLKGLRVH